MRKNKLIPVTIVMVLFVFLETTLFKKLPQRFIYPDIALIILVFFSNNRGVMEGQISGFIVGLVEDILSLSPLGFNAFIKTVIGFLFGSAKGKIFIDIIIFPVLMILAASFIKGIGAAIISFIFLKPEAAPHIFSFQFAIEIAENCILAPIILAFMKLTKLYSTEERSF